MKFAITGIGIINGLGATVEHSWGNLLLGRSALDTVKWTDDEAQLPRTSKGINFTAGFPSLLPSFDDSYEGADRYWSRGTKLGVYAAEQAYKDSGLNTKNVNVVFSTATATFETIGKALDVLDEGRSKFSPKTILNSTNDYISGQVSKRLKLEGPSASVHSACASGLNAIDYGLRLLATDDELDAVLVGASDAGINAFTYFFFQNLNALSNSAPRPFDQDRSGFVIGEGAGAFIIEPLHKAVLRGARIHGLILGTGGASNAQFDINPDPEGKSQTQAILKTLRTAKIRAEQIDYINAHATGTPQGDDIEYEVCKNLFYNRPIVSNKGQIGHCLASAGIIESIYTVLTLRDQVSPGTANLTTPCGTGLHTLRVSEKITAKYAIKNSFAFGGRAMCAVFAKYDGELI